MSVQARREEKKMIPYPERFMTLDAQRRFYRLSIATATSLLFSILMYDMNSIGMSLVFKYLFYILLFVALLLCFKAFETWSFPNDYAGKLPEEEQQHIGVQYRNTFFLEAFIMTVLAVFTFVWTNVSNQLSNEGNVTSVFCLLVAVGCVLFARSLSSRIEY
jgi:hypothetical protein